MNKTELVNNNELPTRNGKKWTDEEHKILLVNLSKKNELEKISEILGRTLNSIICKRDQIIYKEYKNNNEMNEEKFIEKICDEFNITGKKFWEVINENNNRELEQIKTFSRKGKIWTEEEQKILLLNLNKKFNLETISEILGRTVGSIRSKRDQIMYDEYDGYINNNEINEDNEAEFIEKICDKFNIIEKDFWIIKNKYDNYKLNKKNTGNKKPPKKKFTEDLLDKFDNKIEELKEIISSKDNHINKLNEELNDVKSQMKKMNKNLKLILEKLS